MCVPLCVRVCACLYASVCASPGEQNHPDFRPVFAVSIKPFRVLAVGEGRPTAKLPLSAPQALGYDGC